MKKLSHIPAFLAGLLLVLLLTPGCLDKQNIQPDSKPWMKAELNGSKIKFVNGKSGVTHSLQNAIRPIPSGNEYFLSSTFYSDEVGIIWEIHVFFVFTDSLIVNNSSMAARILPGEYPYTVPSLDPVVDASPGVYVFLFHAGTGSSQFEGSWYTYLGPNAGSSFTVEEVTENDAEAAVADGLKKVLINLDCTLYKDDGSSLELKDGIFLGEFGAE